MAQERFNGGSCCRMGVALESRSWEVEIYTTSSGESPFQEWTDNLKDSGGAARIAARVDRLPEGNWGDFKFIGEGVFELRIDAGPGYRIYFAKHENRVILLLCGGDKGSQKRDIAQAIGYWKEYRRQFE
jgi:putative addiction module killer protein